MNLRIAGKAVMALLCSLSLVACSTFIPVNTAQREFGSGSFTLDRSEVMTHLARPNNLDWSYRRANNATLDRLRQTMPASDKADRKLQALSRLTEYSTTTAGMATSSPAWDMFNNRAFWLSDTGGLYVFTVNQTTGAMTLVYNTQVKNMAGTNMAFSHTAVALSNDVKRLYLVSTNGTFLVLNATNGACLYSASVGINAAFTQTTTPPTCGPAPFIDPLTSRPDGAWETIYVIGNSGTATANTVSLYRFTALQTPGAAPVFANPDTYVIPTTDTATVTEGVRAAPIVLGGRAVIGTWRIDTAGADAGAIIYYNTNNSVYSQTSTGAGAVIRTTAVNAPVWGTPAVDTDDDLVPFLTFVATNSNVTMVDMNSATTGQSVPLLVDQATPPASYTIGTGGNAITYTIDPPQSMENYPYTGSTQTKTIYPDTVGGKSCSVTISSTTKALTPTDTAANALGKPWISWSDFFSYSSVNSATDNPDVPAYAYTRYTLPSNAATVAGESVPRGLLGSEVRMVANVSSNAAGANNVTPFNGWIVNNTLNDGVTSWTPDNLTPTNRPTFANGDVFGNTPTFASSVLGTNVHNGEKLRYSTANNPKANSFKSTGGGGPYDWDCSGLIPLGTTKTIAWYDDLDNVGSGETNNGVPHNEGAPHFENGATNADRPYIILTLSARGTSAEGMIAPLSIDSLNQQIYGVNSNALFRLSYQSFTNTGYTAASIAERVASLANPKMTFYSMTGLGSTTGPLYTHATAPTSRFVSNSTAPLITNTHVYVQDNSLDNAGRPTATSITQFGFGTIPTASTNGTFPPRLATVNLTTSNANAQGGGAYLVYDYESELLFANTYRPASTSGSAVMLDRL